MFHSPVGRGAARIGCLAALVVVLVPLGWATAAFARQTGSLKTVRYLGYEVRVPRSWNVYDLRAQPTVCVRFNRHAVYLGTPSSSQQCPAHAAGRTEAILLQPLAAGAASASGQPLSPVSVGAQGVQGFEGFLVIPKHGVLATATWAGNPALIQRALGVRSVKALRATVASGLGRAATAAPRARAPSARPAAGTVYTGLGFDSCSAPSASTMSAWGESPYRAVGVYIGGENVACSQANLTSAWVSTETDAGWRLIPTYVGLQAPSNSCRCQGIAPSQARAEGLADANTAVTQATSLGIGLGNPIYFDMESYPRGGKNTSAVLTFLAAWTTQLHARGYLSGVYSSSSTGISDLVAKWGAGYTEPDDLWFANWNGQKSTTDPYVPGADWAAHQRLHQYQGGHNATYGGATIPIDTDYLNGATAGAGAAGAGNPPANTQLPSVRGTVKVGRTLSAGSGGWSGVGNSYAYQWQQCTPACKNIARAHGQSYTLKTTDVDAMVRVLVTASNGSGSRQAASNPVGPVGPSGYWLYSAWGNVYSSSRTLWLGSAAGRGVRTPSISGMAATPDGMGYWLVSSSGRVYAFGDAAKLPSVPHRVIGIVADPIGGYWLYNKHGGVYASSGAGWFGSVPSRRARTSSVVGMAATIDGRGYWLVASSGRVRAFGDAAKFPAIARAHGILGIVPDPTGGYWLFTAAGNVYGSPGAAWLGSPPSHHARISSIVGMAATADGKGYWLVTSSGTVYSFGDAARLAALRPGHLIMGIADQL